jgi:hypothetical protein
MLARSLLILPVAAGLGLLALASPARGVAATAIDPAEYVREIDNPWFPLKPGTRFVYEGMTADGPERNVVFVTYRTKTVLGVEAVVVRDVVWVDGEPVERTFDYYAQDRRGNVWYLGEDSRDFEDGVWVRSDGSWEAGVDGAEPGIIMKATPRRGQSYRQEFYPGHAEDMASVLGRRARPLEVPIGSFRHVLVTREWTPLEPGVAERKYYAWGLGLIEEQQTRGGSDELELVEISAPRAKGEAAGTTVGV